MSVAVTQFAERKSFFPWFSEESTAWTLHWLFRLGVFLEFLGHGACGVITKRGWLPYFHVLGFSENLTWKLMPIVGSIDIALAFIILFSPRRALLLYMSLWGCFTALLRPAAGEGTWEFVERSYNYGVPFMFLVLQGFGHDRKSWFESIKPVPTLSVRQAQTLLWGLRVIVALMLIGHGGYGAFVAKKNLALFYHAAGFDVFGLPAETIRTYIGLFEIGLGCAALFSAWSALFVFIFVWKLGSELLYPIAGAPLALWEVVERGGSYVAPVAAFCLLVFLKQSHPGTSSKTVFG